MTRSGYQMRKWRAQEARSERIEREKIAAGHDFDAENRARGIRGVEAMVDRGWGDFPGAVDKIAATVAEIRAAGPTTCECGHEYCEAER